MTQNDIVYIKAILTDRVRKHFLRLKEYYGLKSNAEVMRRIIKSEYDRLYSATEPPSEMEATVHE